MPTLINSSESIISEEANSSSNNNKERIANDFKLERNDTAFSTLWKTKNGLYLVLFTIFEAVVVIILESVLYANFNKSVPSIQLGLTKGIPVYLFIFIFSMIFQVALAWDAVHNKNTIQVIAFILFNLCCFSYAVFQFKQIAEALRDKLSDQIDIWPFQRIMIANPVVIGVCQLAYFYLGARLYFEFGWIIYKKIGADPDIRNMYRWYQIFLTILKIDFFFFLGFSIQFLVLVLRKGDVEYPLTIVAIPVTCIGLVLAVYAIRHESKQLISLFFLGLAAGIAYFVFKIYRIYDASQAVKYTYVKEVLTFFACVTLILIILTTINAAICFTNFDKGLKPRLLGNIKEATNPVVNENDVGRTLSLD